MAASLMIFSYGVNSFYGLALTTCAGASFPMRTGVSLSSAFPFEVGTGVASTEVAPAFFFESISFTGST
jgi:hypothetical protein